MPTVHEILKQTGMTDEQIAAIDAKALAGFGGVLTAAETERRAAADNAAKAEQERAEAAQAREAAEVAQRSNAKFYDESIAPALNNWGTEKANLEAQAAYYRTQNEAARAAGFIPAEAPNFQAQNPPPGQNPPVQRDGQGRYVSGVPGSTPGSPVFTMDAIDQRLGTGISNIGWAIQEHQRLTGAFLPDSFDTLAKEADNSRLPFRDYVARKYDFAGKQAALQAKVQKEHDEQVAAAATAPLQEQLKAAEASRLKAVEENDRKWAEKIGSNPDVRIAQPSRFADVARAVKANERPDPLNLNEAQRRQATSQAIRTEISSENAA